MKKEKMKKERKLMNYKIKQKEITIIKVIKKLSKK